MGEVYRADDLTLGQPVALKFLPETVEKDAARLERFHAEVRLSREVAHPNVCRVYDIGDAEGHHFLSMEYVDGEDLASLLRRIGRLPKDKAVQVCQQICAGLAAAHEKGILHRDLKPANVMIDGRGRVRITDFGLAVLAGGEARGEAFAGTPQYMAPEQLAGEPASLRSEVYALGMVLYELFTGKPAFSAATLAEMARLKTESAPSRPSSHVEGLDLAIERVILKCLEREPAERPPSARAVAAALPGGDPLAAALAAGETPSPEMVAAAGGKGVLRPGVAIACLALVLIGVGAQALRRKPEFVAYTAPLDTPREVLAGDARGIARDLGHAEPPLDAASGFYVETKYLDYVEKNDATTLRWDRIGTVQPSPIRFWYRQSPWYLVPLAGGEMSLTNPPATVPGMVSVVLDSRGKLLQFRSVLSQDDAGTPAGTAEPDWSFAFRKAGLEMAAFQPVRSTWYPPAHCDSRLAWTGTYPGQPDVPVRVEAGSHRGAPVYFSVYAPWDQPARFWSRKSEAGWTLERVLTPLFFVLLIGGSYTLAWHNLRRGRGDRKGTLRLAVYGALTFLLFELVWRHHVPSYAEWGILLDAIRWSLWMASVTCIYLAVEPYVRRLWPDTLISWSRLLAGRLRDPLLGRDILYGAVAGNFGALLIAARPLIRRMIGPAPAPPAVGPLDGLADIRGLIQGTLLVEINAVWLSMAFLFFIILGTIVTRRRWAGVALFGSFAVLSGMNTGGQDFAPDALLLLPFWAVSIFVTVRFGLLASMSFWFFYELGQYLPLHLDLTTWYASRSLATIAIVLALVGYAFSISLGGRRLLADPLKIAGGRS